MRDHVMMNKNVIERDLMRKKFREHCAYAAKIVAGWPEWKRSCLGIEKVKQTRALA